LWLQLGRNFGFLLIELPVSTGELRSRFGPSAQKDERKTRFSISAPSFQPLSASCEFLWPPDKNPNKPSGEPSQGTLEVVQLAIKTQILETNANLFLLWSIAPKEKRKDGQTSALKGAIWC